MKRISSNTEKLELNVNYEIRTQTPYCSTKWTSFDAKVGNSFYTCESLEELKERVLNHEFVGNEEID